MKLVSINSVNYGSTGTIMLEISEYARKNGIEAFSYSGDLGNNIQRGTNHAFFGTHFENRIHCGLNLITGLHGAFSPFGTLALIRKLKEIQPDIVHLHNLHFCYINLPILFNYLKSNDVQVVWTLHDCWAFTGQCACFSMVKCEKWKTGCFKCPQFRTYPHSCVDQTKLMWKLKKKWFSGVKNLTIVTPSQWLANQVQQSFLKEYPLKVILNGIDLEQFRCRQSDFRKKFHLEEMKLIVGVSFAWNTRKGLDVFIELSRRLPSNYKIVIVGTDDDVDAQLPKEIISIHRTQDQKELSEIYSAADLFVNPTREEVFGLVNVEALACGTPVITFNTGGSPECINENCGLVVPRDDIDAMEQGILYICENHPFCSEKCVERACELSKDRMMQEYLDLFFQGNKE